MATYLIETYLSRGRAGEVETATARLVHAIAELIAAAPEGALRLRHVRSYFIADDETCFHVVEAPSAEVVQEISRRAALSPDRIVEAV